MWVIERNVHLHLRQMYSGMPCYTTIDMMLPSRFVGQCTTIHVLGDIEHVYKFR